MFCTNCGTNILDEAVVCPHCGAATKNYSSSLVVKMEKKSNPMAVAGFVFAFIFALLGLIFGCIGLCRSKRIDGEGQSLSIAAIVISSLWIVVCLVMIFGFAVLGW